MIKKIFAHNTEYVNINNREEVEQSCIKYITQGNLFLSLLYIISMLFAFSIILFLFVDDEFFMNALTSDVGLLIMITVSMGGVLIMGLIGLFFCIFPKLSPAYRFLAKNNAFIKFHNEIVSVYPKLKCPTFTPSFRFNTLGFLQLLAFNPNAK